MSVRELKNLLNSSKHDVATRCRARTLGKKSSVLPKTKIYRIKHSLKINRKTAQKKHENSNRQVKRGGVSNHAVDKGIPTPIEVMVDEKSIEIQYSTGKQNRKKGGKNHSTAPMQQLSKKKRYCPLRRYIHIKKRKPTIYQEKTVNAVPTPKGIDIVEGNDISVINNNSSNTADGGCEAEHVEVNLSVPTFPNNSFPLLYQLWQLKNMTDGEISGAQDAKIVDIIKRHSHRDKSPSWEKEYSVRQQKPPLKMYGRLKPRNNSDGTILRGATEKHTTHREGLAQAPTPHTYSCTMCPSPRKLTGLKELRVHVTSMHRSDEGGKEFCNRCRVTFPTLLSYMQHLCVPPLVRYGVDAASRQEETAETLSSFKIT